MIDSRSYFLMITTLMWASLAAQPLREMTQSAPHGAIRGRVSFEGGAVFLPGVEILIVDPRTGTPVGRGVTDESGRYRIEQIPPGIYRVEAFLPGFERATRDSVVVDAGATVDMDLSLSIAAPDEQVEVIGVRQEEQVTGTSREELAGELVNIAPVKGDDFQALLPLLPGVVRSTDGRIVMKGGSPSQSSLLLNNSTNVTDPATGDYSFNLPSEAIDRVEVLPNPYAAEFGRFSSGVTNILTRQGGEEWHYTINNFFPRTKVRDNAIMGIGSFTPRVGVRGPLIANRLFFTHNMRYKYVNTRVPSLPALEADTILESFDSFTQFDWNLAQRHDLSATVAVFPRRLDFVNLDTFNPQEVTPNFTQRGHSVTLSERWTFSPRTVLDTGLSFKRYDADVFGQGLAEMEIAPEINHGNFFNLQRRNTRTLQWVETLTLHRPSWKGGEHLFKFGIDVLDFSFDGESVSRPVNVRRENGTLARKIEFEGPTSQRVRSTDVAFYAQDRWRLNDRLLLELGFRVDRDGVLNKTNVSPRLGFVLGLLPGGKGILRGGAGWFYQRTPLNVGAFESFETRQVTHFAEDGVTPLAAPTRFSLRSAEDLETPYSMTWNVEYDHRLTEQWVVKTNFLRRNGVHEFLVDPVEGDSPVLRLDSRGRSRYWEVETTVRFDFQRRGHLIWSYVRSKSKKDLNSFDEFFGNFRNPIIRPNEFSLADTDTPDRFIFRGTVESLAGWLVSPVLEVRDGFPFSAVDEEQEFVGRRNRAGRFPLLKTLDLDIQKTIRLWKWNKVRVGFRVFNILNSFNPRDVQRNVDSAQFGTFFNLLPRTFGVTFQIEN